MLSHIALPIIIAAFASQLVGTIWYTPSIFGDRWMKELKMKKSNVKGEEMAKAMLVSFLCSVVTASVLFYLLHTPSNFQYTLSQFEGSTRLVPVGAVSAMTAGFQSSLFLVIMLWIGFIASVRLTNFAFEKKSLMLFWITSLHDLVSLSVMAAVIYSWRL